MSQTTKQYPIHQCALYKLESKGRLETLLLLPAGGLKGAMLDIGYDCFERPKSNGKGTRTITAPRPRLNRIQQRILRLLSGIEKPSWVISSTKGKSYLDNAPVHQNNPFVLTMDIASFFDRCKRDYVYRFFKERLLMSSDCAEALTDICTWNGSIPTGTSTSQLLAYFAYEDMFRKIENLACERCMTFTLYVDDMTFSSAEGFSPDVLENDVRLILRQYGHTVKSSKTRYYSKGDYKLITGISVSPGRDLLASNSLQERVRKGFDSHLKNPTQESRRRVLGQIGAARLIEEGKFPEIERKVEAQILGEKATSRRAALK